MITRSFLSPPLDPETVRRRALANVYDFLISLAEEAENRAAIHEIVDADEGNIGELHPTEVGLINEEVCENSNPEFAISDKEQTNNSVLLKSNIPA